MYCSKCGKELTGKERFCPKCGNVILGEFQKNAGNGKNKRNTAKGAQPQKQKSTKKFFTIFMIIAVIAFGSLGTMFLIKNNSEKYSENTNSMQDAVSKDSVRDEFDDKGKEALNTTVDNGERNSEIAAGDNISGLKGTQSVSLHERLVEDLSETGCYLVIGTDELEKEDALREAKAARISGFSAHAIRLYDKYYVSLGGYDLQDKADEILWYAIENGYPDSRIEYTGPAVAYSEISKID